ncbi:MAG: FtsB family cell division protein [Microbacteriaceae bacterium]
MNSQRPTAPDSSGSSRRAGASRRVGRKPAKPSLTLAELWSAQLERGGMWFGILVIAGLAVYVLFEPVQTWFGQQQRIAQLTADVTKSEAAVAAISADIERWNDTAFVEAQARQRLLYVYPGDVTYLIVNDVVGEDTERPTPTEAVQSTNINWVDALLASYVASATAPTVPVVEEKTP